MSSKGAAGAAAGGGRHPVQGAWCWCCCEHQECQEHQIKQQRAPCEQGDKLGFSEGREGDNSRPRVRAPCALRMPRVCEGGEGAWGAPRV